MEIKHTIEILTKDIQDIEKLVRNLNNNPVPPRIELDLALSKLRHVYELLLMIRADSESELNLQALLEEEQDREERKNADSRKNTAEKTQADTAQADTQKSTLDTSQETMPEEKSKPVPQEEGVPEPSAEPRPQPEVKPASTDPSASSEKKKKEAAILAEKFKQDRSLNERITGNDKSDVSSKLSGSPIDSIARNIGINDRFQIIRELLNGDSEAYAQLIQQLDSSENFNEAFHVLESRFPDDLENESVQLLVNLTRRRYISGGNV